MTCVKYVCVMWQWLYYFIGTVLWMVVFISRWWCRTFKNCFQFLYKTSFVSYL